MRNKIVLFSILILMVVLALLTGLSLLYESKKAKASLERAKGLPPSPAAENGAVSATALPIDFSAYQVIRGGDDRPMVLIPAGFFPMGENREGDFDESPQRIVFLHAYSIDQYEVTNKDYRRFARMLKRPLPEIPVFEEDVRLLQQDNTPVVGVTWLDAVAYCKWAGKRLPTEAEWEKAARGSDGRKWPWGNHFDPKWANGRGEADGFLYTSPVGHFEAGRSFYGLYDMAGNVSEWVADWYDQFYYQSAPVQNPKGPETPDVNKVLVYRGGSYVSGAQDLRAANRFGGAHPGRGESTVGFRCAKDLENE